MTHVIEIEVACAATAAATAAGVTKRAAARIPMPDRASAMNAPGSELGMQTTPIAYLVHKTTSSNSQRVLQLPRLCLLNT